MASRIKLLPESLINRIAAGEVVERPASIVKELMENSLDAGATRIKVEIIDGGKKIIRVSDNGHGLNREELFLCLERHATSKLTPESDLMDIKTLGFRGEALPSIAAVSKLTILSSDGHNQGHKLITAGGKIISLEPAPFNQGTMVEAADLFYNVPARKKFLKTDNTERAHVIETAQRYALSKPDLRLSLFCDGKEIFSIDERSDINGRILKVLGREAAEDLRPFVGEEEGMKIKGWLCGPRAASRVNSSLFLYVLGRPVRDKLLTKAVVQGYGKALPQGRWPAGVIFVDLDGNAVDVNVHPAKIEVRFRDSSAVFNLLAKAVKETIDYSPLFIRDLGPDERKPLLDNHSNHEVSHLELEKKPFWRGPSFSFGQPNKKSPKSDSAPLPPPPWLEEDFQTNSDKEPLAKAHGQAPIQSLNNLELNQASTLEDLTKPESSEHLPLGPKIKKLEAADELTKSFKDKPEKIRLLAQLHRSYILCQGPEGLYVIDQHAAHERIIFNSLLKDLKTNGLQSQELLFPETVDLSPQQSLAAEGLQAALKQLGFDLAPFGGPTWAIRAVPVLLNPKEGAEALKEILDGAAGHLRELDGAGVDLVLDELSGSWLYILACKAAVKAGEELKREEMESLIEQLTEKEVGGLCPHGRPSVLVLSLEDLKRNFLRT
ncbi:MAG: DNA mismatch repair endonuclease MutL [Deltaproteobacteria bacterium]|jgi:DNA mismatch repair protein MutL|nr:DNA mismatch repair endonuclease MutL [Deltaproteobacteria bacterium]